MAGLVLGVILGIASYYSFPDPSTAADVAKYMSMISSIFLKLIKMIIGPLVLSTLVVGIGHMAMLRRSGASAPRPWAGSYAPRSSRCCSACSW
jgi:Na+/H+-dicarboxylate symporter